MAYMHPRRSRFANFEDVAQEFEHLYDQLSRMIVFRATRAPNSEDPGEIWIFRDGTTNRIYTRDANTGTWRGPTNQT